MILPTSFRHALYVLAALLHTLPVRAQTEARQDTLESLSPAIQEEAEVQSLAFRYAQPDIGEIGLVRRHPEPDTLTLWAAQNVFHTDNAYLSETVEVDSWAWTGSFGLTLVPWAVRDFTPSLTLSQTFFRYDEVSQLDFDAQTATLNLKYDLTPDDDWSINASYSGTRLYTSRFDTGDFYKYGVLALSASYARQLGEKGVTPLYFAGTFGGSYRHGSPSSYDRMDVDLSLTFVYAPLEQIRVFAFARPALQFYQNDPFQNDRRDFNLSLGLGITWQPIEHFSLGANLIWVRNYSNAPFRDYEATTPGFQISARLAF